MAPRKKAAPKPRRKKTPTAAELKADVARAAAELVTCGVESMSFATGGGEPTVIEFTDETVRSLRKMQRDLRPPEPDDHVEGQQRLPGTPEPVKQLPWWEVTLTAKAFRIGVGRPHRPTDEDTNLDEIVCLYSEDVTRKVSVQVQAVDSDEARELGQAKIESRIGSLAALFADYPKAPKGQDWKVKPA